MIWVRVEGNDSIVHSLPDKEEPHTQHLLRMILLPCLREKSYFPFLFLFLHSWFFFSLANDVVTRFVYIMLISSSLDFLNNQIEVKGGNLSYEHNLWHHIPVARATVPLLRGTVSNVQPPHWQSSVPAVGGSTQCQLSVMWSSMLSGVFWPFANCDVILWLIYIVNRAVLWETGCVTSTHWVLSTHVFSIFAFEIYLCLSDTISKSHPHLLVQSKCYFCTCKLKRLHALCIEPAIFKYQMKPAP